MKVIIEQMADLFWNIYNESGACIEPDFDTKEEAEEFAIDQGYEIVNYFNVKDNE